MGIRRLLLTLLLFAIPALAQQPQTTSDPLFAVNSKYVQGIGPGYTVSPGSGLTLNIAAGRARCANAMVNYAGGTLTMANNTTNYVYLDTGSSCVPASNTTGYTSTGIAIATVVTSSGAITTITYDVVFGIASPAGAPCANCVVNNNTNTATSAMTLDMSGSTVSNALKVPVAAAATATANGAVDYDSTNNNLHVAQASADAIAPLVTVSPTNGDCVKWSIASGKVKLDDAGAVCGTGTTITIASGTAAMGTGAISSGACASAVTVSATGVATTDNIMADFNADPTSTTGYIPGAMLTIAKYPTSGNVNFKVCNNTGSSITPSAVTLNWRVVR